MEDEGMNITVVGVVVIILAVIGAVVLIRYLQNRPDDPGGEEISPT
jgi:hypothetical protein